MEASFWIKQQNKQVSYPALEHDVSCNIAIIGAGLTGLSTAYYLNRASKDIMILEADQVGFGASGRNTGKITFQHGAVYHKLMEKYDKVYASRYYQAQVDAMRSIEAIIQEHHIDCDYQKRDALIYTKDVTKVYELQDEYQTYLDLGIEATYLKSDEYSFPIEAGILVHDQASYNPYSYCLGLSDVVHKQGTEIFEHSPVSDVKKEAETYVLRVNDHVVHANKVIFACQFPFMDYMHFYFARMIAIQETLCYTSLHQKFTKDMMVSIDQPMHSANLTKDTLIMSGNKHRSGTQTSGELEAYMQSLYQTYPIEKIEHTWSNEDYLTFDELPLVGKLAKDNDDLFFASGFNAWGNTTSNMAAKILCAYLMDHYSIYAMLTSPQRASFLTIPFLKENMKTALEFIKSRMKKEDIDYPLKKHAKRIDLDGHTYGMYRDEQDELYIVDITCPHMGCILEFNTIDKTWDCPCHGSRFSYQGDIVKGPSTHGLHAYGDDFNKVDPHVIK